MPEHGDELPLHHHKTTRKSIGVDRLIGHHVATITTLDLNDLEGGTVGKVILSAYELLEITHLLPLS